MTLSFGTFLIVGSYIVAAIILLPVFRRIVAEPLADRGEEWARYRAEMTARTLTVCWPFTAVWCLVAGLLCLMYPFKGNKE